MQSLFQFIPKVFMATEFSCKPLKVFHPSHAEISLGLGNYCASIFVATVWKGTTYRFNGHVATINSDISAFICSITYSGIYLYY